MHCLGCGYNLKQLTEPRCPECGRGFDAQDQRTWGTSRAYRYRPWVHRLGCLLLLTAAIPTLLAFARVFTGEAPMVVALIWMYALFPVLAVAGVWMFVWLAADVAPGWRAAVISLGLAVLNTSFLTHWPADLGFTLSRDRLNVLAQQSLNGPGPGVPARYGVFHPQALSVVYTGHQPTGVILALSPGTAGPDYLVYGMTDAEIEASFNLWSYHRLDQDWHIVHED